MEANKRNYHRENYRTSYIEGNTVRRLEAMPDRQEESTRYTSPRRQEAVQVKALSGINITSLLILTVAIVATLFLCVDYLKVQTDINRMDKKIASKQEELIKLTKNNDAAYEAIDASCNLDEIYHVAVEELGMVYPNDNKVIKYQGNETDYVRQYEDIPE